MVRMLFAPWGLAGSGEGGGILARWTGTHWGPVKHPLLHRHHLSEPGLGSGVPSTDVWAAACSSRPPLSSTPRTPWGLPGPWPDFRLL